jgi:hypothetical protein
MRAWLCAITLAGGCLRPNPAFDDADGNGHGEGSAEGDGTGGGTGDAGTGADGSTSGGVTGGGTSDNTAPGTNTATAGHTTESGTTTSSTTGGVIEGCDDTEPNLVACYDFEQADSGTLWDGSGTGNHGGTSGVGLAPGVSGNAGVFGGPSKALVENHSTLNPTVELTLDGWIYVEELPTSGDAGVIDKEGQWHIHVTDNAKVFCSFTSIGSLTGGLVNTGQWTHVACLYDGSEVLMYQDGQQRGHVGTPRPIASGTEDVLIGNADAAWTTPLKGRIDLLRIWNVGLSPEEICEAAGQVGC